MTTDHKFTGQKLDGSGLMYYNARYYDPAIGQFVSPDTIVPDLENVLAYNRYMYSLGNPLKYVDPSGYYSDDALKTHFGCDDWNCVEAQFEEGGQQAGRWGWLKVLMEAQDGGTIRAWSVSTDNLYQETVGSFVTQNGRIMVAPSRMFMTSPSWESPVNVSQFAGSFSEAEFAVRGTGVAGMYDLRGQGNVNTAFGQRHVDCRHTDCVAQAIDTAGIAGSGLMVASPLCGVGAAACFTAGRALGTGSTIAGVVWTGYKASQGDLTPADFTMTSITTATSIFAEDPRVNLTADIVQFVWDSQ